MADRPLPSYSGDAPYFFVTYGHDDVALVHPEMRALQQAGFNLWYDDGIHVGAVWRQAIADALSNAAGVLFFATRSSIQSDNCQKELNFALDEGKPVLVLKLDDTKLPNLLRLSLSDRQMLDRANFDGDAYRTRLVEAMAAIAPPAPAASGNHASRRMPTRVPSIALQKLSTGDRETAFWAEALVGDLVTALGWGITLLFTRDAEPTALGKQPDVGYVLSGNVRRTDDDYRVNLKLTRGDTGVQVWSGRYNEAGAALDVSDAVCRRAASDIAKAVVEDERDRVMKIDDEHLDAWGLCIKAASTASGGARSFQDWAERFGRVRLALERDPDFAMAHSMLGGFLSAYVMMQFSRTPDADIAEALAHMDRALALAPGNPMILEGAALTHRVFGDEALALELTERAHATMVGPRFTSAALVGLDDQLPACLIQAGRVDEALQRMLDGEPFPERMLYTAYAVKGDWPDALKWARRATATQPLEFLPWIELANALAMCGQLDEATGVIERVRGYVPRFTVKGYERGMRIAWRNRDAVVGALTAGLRTLGMD